MARLIKHTATGPTEVKPADQSVWICMYGLSHTYPLCDGHHKFARQQEQTDQLYVYDGDTARPVDDPGGDRQV